jgi:copper chaperone CopZ
MTETATLNVTGMKCGGCEANVKTGLSAIAGVTAVTASSKDKMVGVEFEPNQTDLAAIKEVIVALGFEVV